MEVIAINRNNIISLDIAREYINEPHATRAEVLKELFVGVDGKVSEYCSDEAFFYFRGKGAEYLPDKSKDDIIKIMRNNNLVLYYPGDTTIDDDMVITHKGLKETSKENLNNMFIKNSNLLWNVDVVLNVMDEYLLSLIKRRNNLEKEVRDASIGKII